ncbi:hypothetical protein Efla_004361 [Eimeria flavescens]
MLVSSGKPRGMRTARKLRNRRRVQKWADKQYKKAHLGTRWKANPFGGSSHAKGIVVEKLGIEAKQPNSAIRKCVRVQLIKNGKKITAFVPRDGCLNFIDENDEVLVAGFGRSGHAVACMTKGFNMESFTAQSVSVVAVTTEVLEAEGPAAQLAQEVSEDLAAVAAGVQDLESIVLLEQKLAEICRVQEDINWFSQALRQRRVLQEEISALDWSNNQLRALSLRLQDEMLQLRQKSVEVHTEYEAVQGSIIRELCREEELRRHINEAKLEDAHSDRLTVMQRLPSLLEQGCIGNGHRLDDL